MPDDKDQELRDIQTEETTRGKKQPKKALSVAFQRRIAQTVKILRDPKCDKETYMEAIREYGLQEESDEYRQILALWRRFRGND